MKEIRLKKTPSGLVPADSIAEDDFHRYKTGDYLIATIKKPRNPKFHAKMFSLLNVGFNYWQPGEISCDYGTPKKNFDRFREDVVILAGFYIVTVRLDGSTRVEAESLSYASMDDEKFAKVYSAVLNVLLQKIFVNYTDEEVIKMAEQRLLDYS